MEMVKIAEVVSTHALNFFGEHIVDLVVEDILFERYGDWRIPFTLKMLGEDKDFKIDMRMVENPNVRTQFADFFFYGQVTSGNVESWKLPNSAKYTFSERNDIAQFIFTDRVINSLLLSMQDDGTLTLTTDDAAFTDLTGFNPNEVSTTLLQPLIPQLYETYGADKKVLMTIEALDPTVRIDRGVSEHIMTYSNLKMNFKVEIGGKGGKMTYAQALTIEVSTVAYFDFDISLGRIFSTMDKFEVLEVSVIDDQVGLSERVDDFVNAIDSYIQDAMNTFNEYMEGGYKMPLYLPTFVDYDLYYLQDAILIEMDFEWDD